MFSPCFSAARLPGLTVPVQTVGKQIVAVIVGSGEGLLSVSLPLIFSALARGELSRWLLAVKPQVISCETFLVQVNLIQAGSKLSTLNHHGVLNLHLQFVSFATLVQEVGFC